MHLNTYVHRISTLQREKSSQLYNKRGKFYNEFAELEGEEEKLVTELQIESKKFIIFINCVRNVLFNLLPHSGFWFSLKVTWK